jgi:hypothetical protein
VRELKASVREILTPHWKNINDGEEIQITVINPFDGTEFIKRDILPTPEQKTILFQNILPYPVDQHEVLLLISEPHALKDIKIEKKGEIISANRCVTIETQSIETLTGSEIPKKFPSGISAATAIDSKQAGKSAQIKIRLDFEPDEQIKVIMIY